MKGIHFSLRDMDWIRGTTFKVVPCKKREPSVHCAEGSYFDTHLNKKIVDQLFVRVSGSEKREKIDIWWTEERR